MQQANTQLWGQGQASVRTTFLPHLQPTRLFLFPRVWEEAGFAAGRIRNSRIFSMLSESLSGKIELKLAEAWANASEVGWLLLTLQET